MIFSLKIVIFCCKL